MGVLLELYGWSNVVYWWSGEISWDLWRCKSNCESELMSTESQEGGHAKKTVDGEGRTVYGEAGVG